MTTDDPPFFPQAVAITRALKQADYSPLEAAQILGQALGIVLWLLPLETRAVFCQRLVEHFERATQPDPDEARLRRMSEILMEDLPDQ
jgi:hypothetical protein